MPLFGPKIVEPIVAVPVKTGKNWIWKRTRLAGVTTSSIEYERVVERFNPVVGFHSWIQSKPPHVHTTVVDESIHWSVPQEWNHGNILGLSIVSSPQKQKYLSSFVHPMHSLSRV